MALELPLLYPLQFLFVHCTHQVSYGVLIPVSQTANCIKAKSCLVLLQLSRSAKWMRHCFFPVSCYLGYWKTQEADTGSMVTVQGSRQIFIMGSPLQTQYGHHIMEGLLMRFSLLLHRANTFDWSSFWLLSGIPVAWSSSIHCGGRWWKTSIKPFTSISAGWAAI